MLIYWAMGSIQEGEVSPTWFTKIMAIEESGWQYIGRNIVSVIGRDAATTSKAFSFSLESVGTCSSFYVEKPARRCLTRATYFNIRGSLDSYSAFTCPTTNWESLRNYKLVGR